MERAWFSKFHDVIYCNYWNGNDPENYEVIYFSTEIATDVLGNWAAYLTKVNENFEFIAIVAKFLVVMGNTTETCEDECFKYGRLLKCFSIWICFYL